MNLTEEKGNSDGEEDMVAFKGGGKKTQPDLWIIGENERSIKWEQFARMSLLKLNQTEKKIN